MPSSRDINLAIVGEDLTKPATDSAARNFDQLQKKVDKFSTKQPSKEAEQFARLLTSNLQDGETAADSLQKALVKTRTDLAGMRQEFAKTGSQGLFGNIKQSESDLKFLESALQSMVVEGTKVGEDIGNALAKGAENGAADLPELFTPQGLIGAGVIAAVVGALTPVLVAGLGAAITTGVGFGLLGLGAVIERNSAGVQSAFQHLKQDAASTFQDAASPLEQPIADALASLDEMIQRDGPELRKMFAAVSPVIGLIVSGVENLADGALPDLAKDAQAFGDAFKDTQVQGSLKLMSGLILDIIHQFSANPSLAKDFFVGMLTTINLILAPLDILVRGVSILDNVLSALKVPGFEHQAKGLADWHDGTEAATAGTDDLSTSLAQANPLIQSTSQEFAANAQQVKIAVDGVDQYRQALANTVFSALMSADRATLNWNESLTNLSKTLKDNKVNLSLHKAAGQQDREAILSAVQANIDMYNSMINSGLGSDAATKAYDKNFQSLQHLPGLTKTQQQAVDGLIQKYKNVPDSVNTNLVLSGLNDTLKDLDTVLRKLAGLPPLKTITIDVEGRWDSSANKALALKNGGHALQAAMSWSPVAVEMAGAAPLGVTQAARPISLTSHISSTLVLDGRPIAAVSQRVVEDNYALARVGSR